MISVTYATEFSITHLVIGIGYTAFTYVVLHIVQRLGW